MRMFINLAHNNNAYTESVLRVLEVSVLLQTLKILYAFQLTCQDLFLSYVTLATRTCSFLNFYNMPCL